MCVLSVVSQFLTRTRHSSNALCRAHAHSTSPKYCICWVASRYTPLELIPIGGKVDSGRWVVDQYVMACEALVIVYAIYFHSTASATIYLSL